QPSFNQNYMQQPMPNLEDITDPTTAINMAPLMAKAFKLNYSTPTNNNQRISSNPRNRQIVNGYNEVQNVGNQVAPNLRVQNVLEYGRYGVSNVLDTAYRGFLGVGTTFDIFQNILYSYGLNTAYWSFRDTAYWILFPSWSLEPRFGLEISSWVLRMIPEPGDPYREVPMNETFHVQTDDELTEKELKHIEADDQAIQTILLGLLEDIYAAVDSCETAQEIWLRVQQMMKGSDIGIQEKKAKLFNEWEMFTSNDGESIESYYHRFLKLMNGLKQNKHFPEKIANITNPTTAMNMALALMAKTFKLNYSTPTNNNKRISSNPRNRQIAQPGMNMGQHRQMQMVGGNGGNQFRQYVGQNVKNLNGYNDVQNVENLNPNGNGNFVAARVEGNAIGHNGNQIRCYNCRGVGHFARNCIVRPRRRDDAYLQTQLLIAQKEETGIQLQAEEFNLMAADLDEIEEVNANCILMANLQQASTSGTQTDKAHVYDSDGSAENKVGKQ
nr:hypothetical protein [Tanacetum cinerariifolium]